ncbi:bchH, partial [Symbiodinium sp. CCMP2456]
MATTAPTARASALAPVATAHPTTTAAATSSSSRINTGGNPAVGQALGQPRGELPGTSVKSTVPSSTAATSNQDAIPAGFLGQDPLHFIGAIVAGVLSACLCLFLVRKLCFETDKHMHVKLKGDEESEGMDDLGASDRADLGDLD